MDLNVRFYTPAPQIWRLTMRARFATSGHQNATHDVASENHWPLLQIHSSEAALNQDESTGNKAEMERTIDNYSLVWLPPSSRQRIGCQWLG